MIKLVAALLVLVLLALIWRKWSRRRRAAFIEEFPYAQFLGQRLAARRPELTPAHRCEVFAGLRDYFQLCRTAGRRMVALSEVWRGSDGGAWVSLDDHQRAEAVGMA